MISVKVSYTVNPAFVAANKANIQQFMEDFRTLGHDFRYSVYTLSDGKTFVHLSQYKNEAIQQLLLNLPSFKTFQQQRDESGLEMQPQIEFLHPLETTHQIF